MTPSPPRFSPPVITWAAVLGFALFAPAALPAGGSDRRMPEFRRRELAHEPLLTLLNCSLLASPRSEAPPLAELHPGTPLRVMRTWFEPGGRRWLQVAVAGPAGRPSRGWLLG